MDEEALANIRDWLNYHRPEVLNVAGPRESKAPGIQQATYLFLVAVLRL